MLLLSPPCEVTCWGPASHLVTISKSLALVSLVVLQFCLTPPKTLRSWNVTQVGGEKQAEVSRRMSAPGTTS